MAVFFRSHAVLIAAPAAFDLTARRAMTAAAPYRPHASWEVAADGRPVRRWRAPPPPD